MKFAMQKTTVAIVSVFASAFTSVLAGVSVAQTTAEPPPMQPSSTSISVGASHRMPSSMASPAPQFTKRELIARLKSLQEKQVAEIQTLDNAIRKQLQSSQTVTLTAQGLPVAGMKANDMTKQIDELARKKNETNARREILDRLIFTIDSKWTNQPLQPFLEQQFLEMAASELGDGRDGKLWKALTYLSICVREVPEPREDIINVIEGYMNFTDILSPKTPAEFMASRDYTNGSESASAKPASRDSIGDGIEELLPTQEKSKEPAEPTDVKSAPKLTLTMPNPMSMER